MMSFATLTKEDKPMRKILTVILSVMLLVAIVGCSAIGNAESQYVSIKEIRETVPERWTGEYVVKNGAHKQLKKGDTVSVDVPIVVPAVDTVPVVRITWEPPAEGLDASLSVDRNDWVGKGIGRDFPMDELVFPVLDNNTTFDSTLPWEDAVDIAFEEIHKWIPFMRDKELIPYFHRSYGESADNGYQRIFFYTAYHGIPHLIAAGHFRLEVKSEYGENKDLPVVPASMISIRIKRPGQFITTIATSKEVGVDIKDIPLLSFDEIKKVLEQWVTDGYVYSLNEVHLGYMAFIDPAKKGDEFVLLPIWTAKGRTRADLSLPFELKTDQTVMDRGGYLNAGIIINAQTGQKYDLYNDNHPDRRYVPDIITWDDIK